MPIGIAVYKMSKQSATSLYLKFSFNFIIYIFVIKFLDILFEKRNSKFKKVLKIATEKLCLLKNIEKNINFSHRLYHNRNHLSSNLSSNVIM